MLTGKKPSTKATARKVAKLCDKLGLELVRDEGFWELKENSQRRIHRLNKHGPESLDDVLALLKDMDFEHEEEKRFKQAKKEYEDELEKKWEDA